MSKKLKAAIIGPGNIGTDLLIKMFRSEWIEPVWMVGIDPESDGLKRAQEMGIKTTAEGVDGLLPHVIEDDIRVAFDATSAYVHAENSRKLNELGVVMIDLTPAAIGPFCVPPVNLAEHAQNLEMNVNMVTCGGQATIPMVAAVSQVQGVEYGEIIATVSSRSAGPGTRKNIDEFTRTTAGAVEKVGGADKGKAIIIINPAEPPLLDQIANRLNCSSRTLSRKLLDQGWTYQQLIDQVREIHAKRYLSDPTRSVTQIAHFLGYADSSGFHRAFKKWTGHSPKTYRDTIFG